MEDKRVVASIQVRLGSTRLPGKALFELGDHRMIDLVVRQVRKADEIDEFVVAVGDNPPNKAITEWCRRSGYPFLQGSEDDLLGRHLSVAFEFNADILVRITGDCPFVPSSEIDRMIGVYAERDNPYVTNVSESMPLGTAVDVIDRTVLERLSAEGETHPVKRLREESEAWDAHVSLNGALERYSDCTVAVDTPTDYWNLFDAVKDVGTTPDDVISWVSENV